jgi:RHS repeat-associated protein
VTDDTGNIVYATAHDPYGGVQQTWVNVFNPELKFSGKEQDAESALYYFGARYYDPTLYRFLSPDPVIPTDRALYNPLRWNLYGYCLGNPLKFADINATNPVDILVQRIWELTSENIIVGWLFINGQWSGYTMEHNTAGKLPEGIYSATVSFERGIFGLKINDYFDEIILKFDNSPFATTIIAQGFFWFHLGSSRESSKGCFLVGYDYDFNNNNLIGSLSAFTNLLAECIGHHDLGAAFLAYHEVGLGEIFEAWLWLDALSAIVHATVTVRNPYIGDVPRSPTPWNPWSPNPIYLA